MGFNPNLKQGQILTNNEISFIFKCSTQGGMRRSLKTNTLVIISDHTKSLYEDRWEGDIFHYTGMGRVGDQSLSFAQNKTLAESNTNGVDVFLFEVFKPKEYVFIGKMILASEPYQEQQLDDEGNIRTVWVFPLKFDNGFKPYSLPKELVQAKETAREKIAKKLSNEELAKRAKHASRKSKSRKVTTKTYERDAYVSEYAKRWANGICQLCEKPAPFKNKQGEPHLHTHHIEWLSRGGEDSIYNTVAICPNCHDRMHILDDLNDVMILKEKVKKHFQS
jgi:5-methylcytosine-specific restriction enzyme A